MYNVTSYWFSPQYQWSAEDQAGVTFDLDEVTTSTGGRSSDLVVRPGVLRAGRSYTFTLNATQPGTGRWGSGGLTVAPHPPPRGGRCGLLPAGDPVRPLETLVSYSCSGTACLVVLNQTELLWD